MDILSAVLQRFSNHQGFTISPRILEECQRAPARLYCDAYVHAFILWSFADTTYSVNPGNPCPGRCSGGIFQTCAGAAGLGPGVGVDPDRFPGCLLAGAPPLSRDGSGCCHPCFFCCSGGRGHTAWGWSHSLGLGPGPSSPRGVVMPQGAPSTPISSWYTSWPPAHGRQPWPTELLSLSPNTHRRPLTSTYETEAHR